MGIEQEITDDNVGNMIAKMLPTYINPDIYDIEAISPMGIDIIPNYELGVTTLRTLYRVSLNKRDAIMQGAFLRYVVLTRTVKFELTSIQMDDGVKSSSDLAIADTNALLKFNHDTDELLSEL